MAKRLIRQIRVEGQVAYVPLTKGYEAIIDAADVPLVEGVSWSVDVKPRAAYAAGLIRMENGELKLRSLHRVLLSAPNGFHVDHINSNGLDNRRSNLRLATPVQNQHNQRTRQDNKSGFKGVSFRKDCAKWRARIGVGGSRRSLGLFDTPEAAHAAYIDASTQIYGEFARHS